MNKLFLIDGAAGTGKTDLMKFVKTQSDYDISSIEKITTRKKRIREESDTIDLKFLSPKEFKKKLNDDEYYEYKYGNENYALSKTKLIDSLINHEYTFAIVRSRPTINQIIKDLSRYGLVKRVFVYTDQEKALERMRHDGFTDEEIEFRTNRNKLLWEEERFFDKDRITIINNSDFQEFRTQIRNMIDQFSENQEDKNIIHINGKINYPLMSSLVGKKDDIMQQIKRYPFKKTYS